METTHSLDAPAGPWTGLLDLLWPRVCYLCAADLGGTSRPWLCRRCDDALPRFGPSDRACPRCAAPRGDGVDARDCRDCHRVRPRFAAAVAAGAYRGGLRRLVTGLKYARRREHAWPLAALVHGAWREAAVVLPGDAVLVPMPSTRAARRQRGFDPPELLADELGPLLRRPVARGVLERVGTPPPQASLPLTDRLVAPRGTVRAARPAAVEGRVVLLVDDVLTTGATASEASRVLRDAGAAAVFVLAAARTVTRGRWSGR